MMIKYFTYNMLCLFRTWGRRSFQGFIFLNKINVLGSVEFDNNKYKDIPCVRKYYKNSTRIAGQLIM